MKQAVCLLVQMGHGYLAISRRNDITKWGFPGGKVDMGESRLDAIIRETQEEIGLAIDRNALTPLLTDVCNGDVDYMTTTYLYSPASNIKLEDLVPEEGLHLAVLSANELRDNVISPFAPYNAKVFECVESI